MFERLPAKKGFATRRQARELLIGSGYSATNKKQTQFTLGNLAAEIERDIIKGGFKITLRRFVG